MRKILLATLVLLFWSLPSPIPSFSQETVIPDQVDPYTCAKITTTRPAQFAHARVLGHDGKKFISVQVFLLGEQPEGTRAWVWTAPPGNYAVSVMFFDPASGIQEDVGGTTVGIPPDPPPPPDPPDPDPPEPGGPWQMILFYDAQRLDNYPRDQRLLLNSLKIQDQLKQQGHVLLEVLEREAINSGGQSEYSAYFDAVRGDPMPRIALAPKSGGKVVDFLLPANYDALLALLNSPDLVAYYRIVGRTK